MSMEEMLDNTPTSNKVAFGLFLLAKLLGMCAIAFVVARMNLASYCSLGAAGLLLGTVVYLCIQEMGRQNKKDVENKDIISQMMSDGTLRTRLAEAGFSVNSTG